MTFLPLLLYSLLFNFPQCLGASSNDVKYDITYHNKCLSSDLVLRQFLKINLKQCVKECATRRACESLNFRRQHLLCELYLEGDGVFVPNSVKTGSCVFIKKSAIFVQTPSTCDCSYIETCDLDSHTCEQQECSTMSVQNGKVRGNMQSIGSQIEVECDPSFWPTLQLATCDSSGNWSYIPCVKAICSPNSSLAYYQSSYENVALHKAVNPNETWDPSHVSYMVDGVYETAMPYCAHAVTLEQTYTVDLGQSYTIHALYILNRADCCAERLTNVSILIGESMDTLKLYVYHGPAIGMDCVFEFNYPCQGRYVKIENSNQFNMYLTICEFEVYATPSP